VKRRAFFLLLLALGDAGCWSGRYLAQQGAGQLRLLRARRRIADVLDDPSTDPRVRERLRLAVAARDFGVRVLGLHGGDGYTRFLDTGGAPIAWNVSAAERDRLEPHWNRFPIVGAIPYLGYFHEADARAEAARLEAQGLDVYVRPVAGYSTLGITSDPIYSSMLEGSDARIVEVVLHEMLHGTVYLAGQSEWNESLAMVVGFEGAAAFFAARGDARAADEVAAEARTRERDDERFGRFIAGLEGELRALYARPLSVEEKVRLREPIFERAREAFAGLFPPRRPGQRRARFDGPLNNAVVLAHAVYHRSTPAHRRLLARLGGDLPALVRLYRHAVEDEPDPLAWLASLDHATARR
jgi:predicted aminopeptidase